MSERISYKGLLYRRLLHRRTDSPLVHKWCGQLWNETKVGKVGEHATCLKWPNTQRDNPVCVCCSRLDTLGPERIDLPAHNHMHRVPPSGDRQKSCPPSCSSCMPAAQGLKDRGTGCSESCLFDYDHKEQRLTFIYTVKELKLSIMRRLNDVLRFRKF